MSRLTLDDIAASDNFNDNNNNHNIKYLGNGYVIYCDFSKVNQLYHYDRILYGLDDSMGSFHFYDEVCEIMNIKNRERKIKELLDD